MKKCKIYQKDKFEVSFNNNDMYAIDMDKSGYREVYACEVRIADDENVYNTLEAIFEELNMAHPYDYHARSLSVGDIVVLDEEAFICNSLGFSNVTLV